jgi:hypothetical protein
MNTMHKGLIAIATGLALSGVASAGTSNVYIGEDSGSFHLSSQPWTSTRTRAEVVAELQAAQQRGEVAAMTCEDSGSSYLARRGQMGAAAMAYAGPNAGADRAAAPGGGEQLANR